jgi:hypothetical protein
MRQTPPIPTPLTHEVVADVKLPAPVRRLRQVVATLPGDAEIVREGPLYTRGHATFARPVAPR